MVNFSEAQWSRVGYTLKNT